jgi:hypothetical protein
MSTEGAPRAVNPFAAAGDRSVDERVASLKLRTALLCGLMLACAVFGWRLLQQPLTALVLQAAQWLAGGRGLPLPHVPDGDAWGVRGLMQTAAVGAVAGLGLIGHSYGRLGKMSLRWALLPPLAMALVFAWIAPATRGLPLIPGPLERDILAGRAAAAERHLESAEAGKAMREYVLAQVAMRSGDAASLARSGEAVLQTVDRAIYGVPGNASIGLQYEPTVVRYLDLKLNGQPQTEVGLAALEEGRGAALRRGAGYAGRVVLGILLLGSAAMLLRVWNAMRRRVASIDEQLAADAAAQAVPEDRGAPPQMARPLRAPQAAAPPSLRWRRFIRPVALVAVPLMALKLLFGLEFTSLSGSGGASSHHGVGVGAAEVALTGDTAHPCELVGVWVSSRSESVFKVTLREDGSFTGEPLAAGPYGHSTRHGRWEMLDGRRMRWVDNARPTDLSDVNPILESNPSAFTLREVNGSTSRFNRMDTLPGKRCK